MTLRNTHSEAADALPASGSTNRCRILESNWTGPVLSFMLMGAADGRFQRRNSGARAAMRIAVEFVVPRNSLMVSPHDPTGVNADSEFASLAGRRALVTGSSSGIGRAIALEFARAGADVIVHCARSVDQAQLVSAQICDIGRRSEVMTADIAQPAEVERLADTAWELFHGLDICVNNAGADLLTGEGGQLDYLAKLDRLHAIDVRGTVMLCRLLGHRMRDAGAGVLINIGWDQADRGMEGESGELFSAAKNAIMGLTRSLAVSLAPGVRVNCIAPGWIRTAWGERASDVWQQRVVRETPLKRWGKPEDIAKLARFLASDEADYITGQIINANGGAVR